MGTTSFTAPSENLGQKKILYGIRELAEMLGISRSSIYAYCRSNELRYIKIGERRLVERSEVDAFIERMRENTPKPPADKPDLGDTPAAKS